MNDVVLEVVDLWKRFHRGEYYDSLRDWVPALVGRLLGRRPTPHVLGQSDFWALREVSFQVRRGEVLGIIGSNGAGKSTLLKILARILKPTQGMIRIRGRLRALIEIAAGFHPDLTGRENIYLNGTILGMRRREIDARFDEIVEFSGLAPFLDTPVKRYSSGMQARLGFAIAAHLEPEILLVDEVLAVGDAEFQRKCLGKMQSVAGQGRTVLFVSHNMAAVSTLCETALYLQGGTTVQYGPVGPVLDCYLRDTQTVVVAQNGTIDLRNVPRAHHLPQKVRFVELQLLNSQGQPCCTFGVGEPITLSLTLQSDIAYDEFIIGFSLRTPSDVILYTSASDDSGERFHIRPGRFKATCLITPNFMRPGTYYLQVGCEARGTQDLIEQAACLEIVATRNYSKSALYNLPGYFYFQHAWSLEKLDVF